MSTIVYKCFNTHGHTQSAARSVTPDRTNFFQQTACSYRGLSVGLCAKHAFIKTYIYIYLKMVSACTYSLSFYLVICHQRHSVSYVCVCRSLSTIIGVQQRKQPCLPAGSILVVMSGDDKPLCGGSWRKGLLVFEGDRGHHHSLCTPKERDTLRVGLNSGLTFLSAPEVAKQTC